MWWSTSEPLNSKLIEVKFQQNFVAGMHCMLILNTFSPTPIRIHVYTLGPNNQ